MEETLEASAQNHMIQKQQQQKIKMTHNYLNKNRQVVVRIGPVNR